MNDRTRFGVRDVSRLTRAGRLTEATVLLQRVLRGGKDPYPASSGAAVPQTIDLVPEAVEVTHPEPPLHAGLDARAEGATPAYLPEALLPEALRRFLDRVTRTPAVPDPGRAAKASAEGSSDMPDRGQFLGMSFKNQAGSRAYKLYVPSRYCGQPLPLIVMLHGCTQSPDDFAAGTRMNLRADEHNCFVAYPEQAASANVSKCWNWFRPGDQTRGEGEPSLIAGITRQIISDYSVDEQRVYAAGLSAGAAAAAVLAATYPDLYAAIGVHSGLACGAASDVASAFAAMRRSRPSPRRRSGGGLSGAAEFSRTVPAIVFHGDQDTTVHPHNSAQVIAQLQEGLNADLRATVEHGQASGGRAYTRTLYSDTKGHVIFEQWVTHGAGHAWSGGSSVGSYTDPQGPDATREMLRFFLEHPMSS
jgi:poly(hydroxyalkanoate) depolymerase family esterase